MGSPEKPIDVEMGDMSEKERLHQEKSDEIKENGNVEEPERFTGLKKEDLLKISNEPKWVRARWVLFIIFWIVWIAMLVGAILIVVNAPRCKPEPTPKWYQDTVVYELNAEEFTEEGIEGVQRHLPYINNNLHVKTLLLVGAEDKKDNAEFKNLVKAVHEIKEGGHIVVDVVVDSLPITSVEFIESSSSNCAANNGGENCDLFLWKTGNITMDDWRYESDRNASYKLVDNNRAVIDYSSGTALDYILAVIGKWFENGVDGIKVRDLSKLHNIADEEFVDALWNHEVFQNNSDRALFVYSSTPKADINPVMLGVNKSNSDSPSPVFLTSELSSVVNQNNAGFKMENIINNWRNQSRCIGGYLVSPTDENLAASRFGGLAAGFNLLSMSLPGVPILRSGDEMAALQPQFKWEKVNDRDSTPLNGSSVIRKQTKELIVRRVAGIQAKPSLRYDTRDNDTVFTFLKVGTQDIIAFIRKWDKKGQVLVVSNLSPNNHTINLIVKNGLVDGSGQLSTEAKILVTTDPSIEDPVKLDKIQLNSGTTLIMENP